MYLKYPYRPLKDILNAFLLKGVFKGSREPGQPPFSSMGEGMGLSKAFKRQFKCL
jgi:hypothetical protein